MLKKKISALIKRKGIFLSLSYMAFISLSLICINKTINKPTIINTQRDRAAPDSIFFHFFIFASIRITSLIHFVFVRNIDCVVEYEKSSITAFCAIYKYFFSFIRIKPQTNIFFYIYLSLNNRSVCVWFVTN